MTPPPLSKLDVEETVKESGGGRIGKRVPNSSVRAIDGATGDVTGDERNDCGGVSKGTGEGLGTAHPSE
jgi:hypothetical protein